MAKRANPSRIPETSAYDPGWAPLKSQRTDRVAQITDPRTQFEQGPFASLMGGQANRLNSLLSGPSISSALTPINTDNILESFRLRQNTPGFESTLPLSELTANYTHPVMRYVKPFTEAIDAISLGELAIEFNDDANNMETMRTGAGVMQSNPMTVVNTAIFNNIVYNQQVYDAQEDYEAYLDKRPWDYWEKWRFGGIVEFEQMLDGSESTQTSGLNLGTNMQRASGYKLVTLTAKGPQFMGNLFGSNIKPGAKCYGIFKKQAPPTEFHLSGKNNTLQTQLGQATLTAPVDVPVINNLARPILPYMMSYVCLPNGGLLPPEATMYYDESGDLQRDGIVIYLGKVWSVPIDHVYKPLNNYYDIRPMTSRTPFTGARYAPRFDVGGFNDARVGVDRESIMQMKLLFDCDDGIAV